MRITAIILAYFWLMLVWGTCAYAVFWLDRSGWWFLLAMLASTFSVTAKFKSK